MTKTVRELDRRHEVANCDVKLETSFCDLKIDRLIWSMIGGCSSRFARTDLSFAALPGARDWRLWSAAHKKSRAFGRPGSIGFGIGSLQRDHSSGPSSSVGGSGSTRLGRL